MAGQDANSGVNPYLQPLPPVTDLPRLPPVEGDTSQEQLSRPQPSSASTALVPIRPLTLYEAVLWSVANSQLIRTIDGGTVANETGLGVIIGGGSSSGASIGGDTNAAVDE